MARARLLVKLYSNLSLLLGLSVSVVALLVQLDHLVARTKSSICLPPIFLHSSPSPETSLLANRCADGAAPVKRLHRWVFQVAGVYGCSEEMMVNVSAAGGKCGGVGTVKT